MMDIDIVIAIATYGVSLPESSSFLLQFNSLRRQGKLSVCVYFLRTHSVMTSRNFPISYLPVVPLSFSLLPLLHRCCLKPPVQIYGIEGRYATALYSAASKQNKLEQVEKELLRVGVSSFPVHC